MPQDRRRKQRGVSNSLSFDSQAELQANPPRRSGRLHPMVRASPCSYAITSGSNTSHAACMGLAHLADQTIDILLNSPRLVYLGGWREQTKKRKQSVLVFHCKPRVRSVGRASKFKSTDGLAFS